MFGGFAKAIFGSSNDRYVRSLKKIVDKINALEPAMSAMTDEELKAQTAIFRARLAKGEELDDLLPEAFATVREAAQRTLGQRHYDVQLVGGIVLHRGEIAEMRTGEGKTLVATLAVYLNALEGKGVHVVTVNDYLARRDADWMGQIYRFLGMTVGVIVPNLSRFPAPRRLSFRHHLRHQQRARLRLSARQYEVRARADGPAAVQFRHRRRGRFDPDRRGAHAADHLGPDRRQVRALYRARPDREGNRLPEDYEYDEKDKRVLLTEDGTERMERLLEEAGAAGRLEPLRLREHPGGPPPQPGAARPMSRSSATSITSSRTARSSSSTRSPGA